MRVSGGSVPDHRISGAYTLPPTGTYVGVWTSSYGESPRQIEGPHVAAASVTRSGNLPIFLRIERKPQLSGY